MSYQSSNDEKASSCINPPVGGNRFTGWLGEKLLRLSGWKIDGALPKLPKMVIAIAPHTSNWDFFLGVAVLFALRIKIRFLGKHTIFVPIAKQFLEAIGGIPVERSAPHGVVGQIVKEFNAQSKMIFAVAPEGTRSPIYPWKSGFLAIAHKANVPVVLIGFDFTLKCVSIGPVLNEHLETDLNKSLPPDVKIENDMRKVYEFYATVSAKYPNKVLYEAKNP